MLKTVAADLGICTSIDGSLNKNSRLNWFGFSCESFLDFFFFIFRSAKKNFLLCYKIRGGKVKILIYKKKEHEKLLILFLMK